MSERVNEKEIICVICPNSCRLSVWRDPKTDEVQVEGYTCPRGKDYGYNEYTNPVRMLITTMRVENGILPVIPVRSTEAIPKAKMLEAIKLVNDSVCHAPVKMGDILIPNLFDTGVDVIASRDMDKVENATDFMCTEDISAKRKLHSILLNSFYEGITPTSEDGIKKLETIEKQIINALKQEYSN